MLVGMGMEVCLYASAINYQFICNILCYHKEVSDFMFTAICELSLLNNA